MNSLTRWLGTFGIVLVLAGCGNDRMVNNIRMVTVLGFDDNPPGYVGTAIYSDFTQRGKVGVLEGRAKQTQLILNEMNGQSAQPVKIEKLRLLLFSRELAERGLSYFINSICRNPLISNYLTVAVSEEPVASLAKIIAGQGSGELPYHLIEQNMKSGNIPRSNLSMMLFDYHCAGRDVSLPIIRLNGAGRLQVSGYGIFKGDRLKLTLNPEEMFYYKLLQGYSMRGEIPFTLKKHGQEGTALFSVSYGRESKHAVMRANGLHIQFQLAIIGMVKEYPRWMDLRKDFNDREVDRQLEKQMRDRMMSLLVKLRDSGVDPLGAGDLVRAYTRDWDEKEFYERMYPKTAFDIAINLQLTKSGIGE
ncbi:Ger(x)C family germination protein [Paenibacillus rhizosphaerae]|uniref:Ger(X)C family germination protein n=1 Tax=Paenibacillus rhizosphaerae TaxID=297318 RepID=A0A839TYR2_9BACL|nr:Ger(x)C family spore germination protein [Paenibacillus rhizosphaerae]MBB3130359.1 Ger(x)C family germination protein [Paenibacillus rhizosphaerae]